MVEQMFLKTVVGRKEVVRDGRVFYRLVNRSVRVALDLDPEISRMADAVK
jgi:hypothetical protein